MPDKFILTDPDLEFNSNLPIHFIEELVALSNIYKSNKIGFALDISEPNKMYTGIYHNNKDICAWEAQFWSNKIPNSEYELYIANIDTTFCLINKRNTGNNIRVAGRFTAKHLPWYIDNQIFNVHDNYIVNTITTSVSTTSAVILSNINKNYIKINKNNELFLIRSDNNINFPFWKNIYQNWEADTFKVFDTLLRKDKIFIDIGGWIGTTCMYGSRKSKHVYSVEADIESFNDMKANCKINCKNNYTLLNNAIYNIDNIFLKFGKNKFLNNSRLNDSTSQIYLDNESSTDCYSVKTVTINNILENNNINPLMISLIKVDIEGGEEYILDDLYNIYTQYKVPLYISFHVSWWKNNNLSRFKLLSNHHLAAIKHNPFISILFT